MLIDYQLGQTAIILRVKIRSGGTTPAGNGLTGATNTSSGLRISTIADTEATATVYTSAGSTIQAIATLGTFAAPTSGDCRFGQVDATNHPGIFEIQLANARFNVSNAKSLLVSITGLSNQYDCDVVIPLRSVNPYDGVRFGMTALPNAAAGASGGLPTGNSSGQVTVATNNDKTGYSLSTAPPTAAAVATAVWQDLTSSGDFTTASSIGKLIATTGITVATNNDKSGYSLSTAPPTSAAIATAVWQDLTSSSDFTTSSSIGKLLANVFPTNFSGLSINGSGYVQTSNPGSAPTAAQVATAVWQDLTSSSDFTTASSIGLLLATDINATISSRSTYAGADTSGTTTLLSRLGQAILFDGAGYVKSDPQTNVTVASFASGLVDGNGFLNVNAADIGGATSAGAAGYAGIDWGNVHGASSTVSLSGTTIATSQIVASVSGAAGSVTGNVGGNVNGKVIGGGATSITGVGAWSDDSSGNALATSSQATAIQNSFANLNNLSATANIFGATLLVRPISGSSAFVFKLVLRTESGGLTDADSNAITLAVTDVNSTDYSGRLSSVTHVSTGVYTFTFTVQSTDADDSFSLDATCMVSSVPYRADLNFDTAAADSLSDVAAILTQVNKLQFDGSSNVLANAQATAATLTFNQNGNVSGSVGTVTGAVTVGTNNDKAGYSLSTAGVNAVQSGLSTLTQSQVTGGSYPMNTDGGGNAFIVANQAVNVTQIAGGAATVDGAGRLKVDVDGFAGTSVGPLPANFSLLAINGSGQVESSNPGSAPTAAQVASQVWGDLLISGDFGTSGSIGQLLNTNVNATISSRSTLTQSQITGGLYALNTDSSGNVRLATNQAVNASQIGGQNVQLDSNNLLKICASDWNGTAIGNLPANFTLLSINGSGQVALQSGQQVDLVNAPNSTAITAIQNGLATAVDVAAVQTKLGTPATSSIAGDIAEVEDQTDLIGTNSADSPNAKTTQTTIATNLDATVSSRLAASAYTAFNYDALSVNSPVGPNNSITLWTGNDYYNSDGRAAAFSQPAGVWSNLAGATVTLKMEANPAVIGDGSTSLNITGVVSASGSNVPQAVYFEFSAAQTAALNVGAAAYDFAVVATLANGHDATLVSGSVWTKETPA